MFDIGFTELMLIGIVALVVIGPERLPAVAKTAGQWIAKLQRFVRGVKTDLASELETGDLKKLIGDQRVQINELKDMVSSAKKDFEASSQTMVSDAKSTLNDLETSAKSSESSSAETAPADTANKADTQSQSLDAQTESGVKKTDDASDSDRAGS